MRPVGQGHQADPGAEEAAQEVEIVLDGVAALDADEDAGLAAVADAAEILGRPDERQVVRVLGDKAVEMNPAMKVGLAASSLAPGLIAGPICLGGCAPRLRRSKLSRIPDSAILNTLKS